MNDQKLNTVSTCQGYKVGQEVVYEGQACVVVSFPSRNMVVIRPRSLDHGSWSTAKVPVRQLVLGILIGERTEFIDHESILGCIDCPKASDDILVKATKAIRTVVGGEVMHYAVCSSGCYARLMSSARQECVGGQ